MEGDIPQIDPSVVVYYARGMSDFNPDWARYCELTHGTRTVVSPIAGLFNGFGLNAMHIMSFYHLFIPTECFIVFFCQLMAKESARAAYLKEVATFPTEQTASVPILVKNCMVLTKGLCVFSPSRRSGYVSSQQSSRRTGTGRS